jgi:hypothetical protein
VSLWVDVDVPTCMRNQNDEADCERDGEQQRPKPTEEPEQGERNHVSIVAPKAP